MTNRWMTAVLALSLAAGCGDDESVPGDQASGGSAGSGGAAAEEDPVDRGRYLVDHVIACPDCHTPRDEMGAPLQDRYMAGVECFVPLENGSCLNTPNLTNDATGLANRTDDEIKTMITTGVRPTATGDEALNPFMPYYVFHNMRESDLNAVVAYLRSIPAVEHAVPRSGPEFEVSEPVNPIDLDTIPMPAEDYANQDSALRGRYLATQVGLCIECHTPHEEGPNVLDPSKYFQGGERFEIGLPVVPVSKNLTSDQRTGLGDWSVREIMEVLKDGVDLENKGICPPMPAGPMAAYGGLTDDDARDIANYLKSLPPIENEIEDMCTWPPM